jgi:uroporphyrin-III C-methyltransferase/precorrin-2 dehydrogenase/sirohydrochlorin ferrochelatase
MIGKVFLVGAGPGDPKLLTVRAHELLSRCDVLAHDELVSDEVLAIAPRRAERIRVGRRGRGVRHHEGRIHPLVLERALAGRDVVRLKGGDPMVFGRGGEEIEELRAAGIPFEVVPGITAALGAAASLAFPLTHRDAAHSVTLRTAHRADERRDGERREETLVFYMGLASLSSLAATLIAEGHAPHTPALVVSNATRRSQRHVLATLSTIGARTRAARLEAPALLFVGAAVASAAVRPVPARGLRLLRTA